MRIVYVILSAIIFMSADAIATNKTSKKRTSSFHRVIGGKSYDAGKKIIKLPEGGYLIAGRSASYGMGDTDMLLVKISESGQSVWEKTFGEDETDEANDLIATKDGGYLVVGHSDSYGYSPDIKDFWAIKIDKNGEEVWNKTFGTEETIDEANAVVETEDGYILVGTTIETHDGAASDILVVKIDKSGEKVWEKKYGESGNEQGLDIISNGEGFTIIGNTEGVGYEEGFSKGRWDIMALHITAEGEMTWKYAYGGKNNEMGNSIMATSDGGYLLAGYTYSFAVASLDAWVVKIDNLGKQIWAKNFGGLSTDEAFSLIETADGNFVMVGYTEVFEPNEDYENISTDKHNILLVKMNAKGDKIWERSIGGEHNQKAFDVVESADGGLVIVGTTDAKQTSGVDLLVMKLDASGMFK